MPPLQFINVARRTHSIRLRFQLNITFSIWLFHIFFERHMRCIYTFSVKLDFSTNKTTAVPHELIALSPKKISRTNFRENERGHVHFRTKAAYVCIKSRCISLRCIILLKYLKDFISFFRTNSLRNCGPRRAAKSTFPRWGRPLKFWKHWWWKIRGGNSLRANQTGKLYLNWKIRIYIQWGMVCVLCASRPGKTNTDSTLFTVVNGEIAQK